jgi:hypothetical protein
MKSQLTIIVSLLLVTILVANGNPRLIGEPTFTDFETRCGWFSNPTPANIWLYDRDGDWTIGVQGGIKLMKTGTGLFSILGNGCGLTAIMVMDARV